MAVYADYKQTFGLTEDGRVLFAGEWFICKNFTNPELSVYYRDEDIEKIHELKLFDNYITIPEEQRELKEKKQREIEEKKKAEEEQRKLEKQKRIEEEQERQKQLREKRKQQIEELKKEKAELKKELESLHGVLGIIKRREIEKKLAAIEENIADVNMPY